MRYEVQENDDEDWGYCVVDTTKSDDENIIALCCSEDDASMIVKALNGAAT